MSLMWQDDQWADCVTPTGCMVFAEWRRLAIIAHSLWPSFCALPSRHHWWCVFFFNLNYNSYLITEESCWHFFALLLSPTACRRQGDVLLYSSTLRLHLENCDWSVSGGEKAPDKWAWLVSANQRSTLVYKRKGEWIGIHPSMLTKCLGRCEDHPSKVHRSSAESWKELFSFLREVFINT